MRIWLKPERMAALNISPSQVRQALAANNYLTAVGQTKGSLIQVNLTANSDLHSVEEFKRLVIREQEGTLCGLKTSARLPWGRKTMIPKCGCRVRPLSLWGFLPCPTPIPLT